MSRDLPNLGLKGGYNIGEDDWGDEQNANLLKLSVLVQGGVTEIAPDVPGTPTPGTVLILDETNATNPNAVAVFEGPVGEEAWSYFEPAPGWLLWDNDQAAYVTFDGTAWAVLETGGGGADYPDFTGNAGKVLAVNDEEDGVEWVDQVGGGPTVEPFLVEAVGTGTAQSITLPRSGLAETDVLVFVQGLYNSPDSYTISGSDLTITTNAVGDKIAVASREAEVGAGGVNKGWWWDPPLAADFTSLGDYLGDATVPTWTDDEDVGLLISCPIDGTGTGTGDKARFYLKPIPNPSETWSVEWQMNPECRYPGEYPMLHGICLVNAAKTKRTEFGFDMRQVVYWGRFNNPSGYGGSEQQQIWSKGAPRFWKVEHDSVGALLNFYASENGKIWSLIRSTSDTNWLGETPKFIGLGLRTGNTNLNYTTSFTVERWVETNFD